MSLTYELLTMEQAARLRKQRLLDLEADHWRFSMDLEELTSDAGSGDEAQVQQIRASLAEVERRIALHRAALGDVTESQNGSDGAG